MNSKSRRCLVLALFFSASLSVALAAPASAADTEILTALKNSAAGPGSGLAISWTGDPCLQAWFGVQCDEKGAIVALNLTSSSLVGPILPQLGNLTSLQLLDLSHNLFTGPLPPHLAKLPNLRTLNLGSNNLSGSIPPEIANLLNLTTLHLNDNHLNGSIPQEISSLVHLTALHLSENALTGPIPPQLATLPNLQTLNLASNLLSGPIPIELSRLLSLQFLDLHNNQLTDEIPPSLSTLTNLTWLDLSSNSFTGAIPLEFGNLSKLAAIGLNNNNLTGPIPPQLGNLPYLIFLQLHNNSLTGPIPPALCNLPYLKSLSLFLNNLTGTIPPEIGNLSSVVSLALQQNSLEGTIPPELCSCSKLKYLGLFQNNFSGPIPSQLFNIPNLTAVTMSQNSLTGPIPTPSGDLPLLQFFDFSQNFLNGSVPAALQAALNSTTKRVITTTTGVMLAAEVFSTVALNCLNLSPGHFYEPEQRDSQICAKFYPDLKCSCPAKQVIGMNGYCYCVSPLHVKLLFTFAEDRSVTNFSTSLSATLRQLAFLLSVDTARLAPVSFTPSLSLNTVEFVFNLLPQNGTLLGAAESTKVQDILQQGGSANVTIPGFNPGFIFLSAEELKPPELTAKGRARRGVRNGCIAAAGALVTLAMVATCVILLLKWRQSYLRTEIPGSSTKSWTFSELSIATDGFSEKRVLGKGGFGTVYQGSLEGVPIAVKRLDMGVKQGHREFIREVDIIGRLQHGNLVKLMGYCIKGDERLIVYDFMANGSLEDWLFGEMRERLPWSKCVEVLLGTARAISHLHHACKEKIIHRDIKPANILLDSNFAPHVSDFGLARSTLVADTHVTTKVMGTFGYLAPEYAQTGHLTEKSDVYSYGVVMLAVVSHKRPIDTPAENSWMGLVELALDAHDRKRLGDIVAPHFTEEKDREEAIRIMSIALVCIQRKWQARPSMEQVVEMIQGTEAIPSIETSGSSSCSFSGPADTWVSDTFNRSTEGSPSKTLSLGGGPEKTSSSSLPHSV